VSTQNNTRPRSSPTVPICPGCRKPMVFVEKRHILFSDGLLEVTYRCETCGTETQRIVKEP
jgi:RNase P subunit RPR2